MSIKKHIKMPKEVFWLMPGLQVKRWFLMIVSGAVFATIGICILFDLRPILFFINLVQKFANKVPSDLIAIAFVVIGGIIFLEGWQKSSFSLLDVNGERDEKFLLEQLYKRRKLNNGPKIVAVGGGTGLSTLLKGLKEITNNITAIVTVGDDGGSSGRLRQELGVLPPGDIRNCIAALASDEDLMTELMQYRFKNGEGLEGHSFGNLFLTALCSITGDMFRAVRATSNVLSIRGRVLPSTLDDMRLAAEMEDGTIVRGESLIPEAKKKIKRLFCEPANCKALDEVIESIKQADLIILGPGSLYTSVIPNLLIDEISKTISKSKAKKIYICNIMTQPGETDGYSVSDHVRAIMEHAKYPNMIETVMVNNVLPQSLIDTYKAAKAEPVILDKNKLAELGVKITSSRLTENNQKLIRHSSYKLARAIYTWYRKQKGASKE